MSFVIVIVILGFVFMLAAFSKAVQRYYAKASKESEETEEEDVVDTVKFLLGTPASDEDRQAVNEFNEFMTLLTKVVAVRPF